MHDPLIVALIAPLIVALIAPLTSTVDSAVDHGLAAAPRYTCHYQRLCVICRKTSRQRINWRYQRRYQRRPYTHTSVDSRQECVYGHIGPMSMFVVLRRYFSPPSERRCFITPPPRIL
jgi:hypothetical protein